MTNPHYRVAGAGRGIVCLHSNASSSSQWRALMERLSPRYRLWAVDSYGAGKTPRWDAPRLPTLGDEVDLIAPVLREAGERPFLVGHSYGGAVALIAALRAPAAFSGVVVYEPTLFNLLDPAQPRHGDAAGILAAVAAASAAVARGDLDAAAGHFLDFWIGDGAWAATPSERKPAIAATMVDVERWAAALTREPTPLAAFGELTTPLLLLTGARSPRSALAVAEALLPALPNARAQTFPTLGHMGPLTDPDRVNAAIETFVDDVERGARPAG
ncbi:MAG: alpha/beta fold hydrolase [Lautropia sp.]